MDAQKASYSITLMAKVLGVTRAGYYAWKKSLSIFLCMGVRGRG